MHAELRVKRLAVALHGISRQKQRALDVGSIAPLSQQAQKLRFTLGKAVSSRQLLAG